MLKKMENSGTEEIGLVTPTPDVCSTFSITGLYARFYDGSVQDCSMSSANALDKLQSHTKPLISLGCFTMTLGCIMTTHMYKIDE